MEISRSEQKRRMKMLEETVAEICGLPDTLIRQLPLAEEIRALLLQAVALKGGAKNRQIKFVTKLLRDEPLDAVYDFLAARKGAALQDKKDFHELEYLRDALLNEAIDQQQEAEALQEEFGEEWSSRIIEEISAVLPGIDKRLLTSLAWMYARGRNPRYRREIFRQMRAARELQKRQEIRSKG